MQLKRTFNSACNFLLWLITVISITALILLCVPKAFGQIVEPKKPVPVKPIPPVIAAKAGQFFYIEAEGDVVSFDFDAKEFPPKTNSIVEAKRLILVTGTNGKYVIQVAALTGKDIKQTRVVATVTGGVDPLPVPIPPPPDGGDSLKLLRADMMAALKKIDERLSALEGPRPPPAPPDLFAAALKVAYLADGKPAADLGKLISIYKESSPIVNNPVNKTPAHVFGVMHAAIAGALKEPVADKMTVLPNVRRAIGAELDRFEPLGPSSLVPFDAEGTARAALNNQFYRVQKALEGIAP